ncbi:fucose isomerase [Anaerolentibacter hominis]|uniref:L-fucose/L-arabinose isomerase family protein n=1 Tax=Anaerolentibacter hominis TaxID=3079009 RepID=UPI0031B80D9B
MERQTVKIGFAPTKRDVFNHPEAFEVRDAIRSRINDWRMDIVEIVDIDDVTPKGIVETEDDALAVIEKFKKEEVAGIFAPHCNFGSEGNTTLIARALQVPFLLWGPRDNDPMANSDTKSSSVGRTRDSQCGLFATGKALRRARIPFTYIPNTDLDEGTLENGFKGFAAVAAVVKAFKETKVLQIGTRPDPFWTTMCNEGELYERFGIRVFPMNLIDMKQEADAIRANKPEEVKAAVEKICSMTKPVGIDEAGLENMAVYYLTLQSLCDKYKCNAAAVSCWGPFARTMGASACAVNGYVTDLGIPVGCELDIHGVISSRMIQAAALYTDPVFFADLTIRHPYNDNAELLWHCGNFPPSLAGDYEKRTVLDSESNGAKCPGRSHFELKRGDITVCRFDGDNGEYSLFIGEGKGVEGPETNGTYCWLEVDDWVAWEEKLVTGPYIHHSSSTYGKLAPILHEACKYLGITPDPAGPTEKEIQEFWRGRR